MRPLALALALLLSAALTAPASAQDITKTSHQDEVFLYNSDFRSAYASFVVTNNTGAQLDDVVVSISLPGPFIVLADNENPAGTYAIGDLPAGDSAPAFFYLKTTAVPPMGANSQNEMPLPAPEMFTVSTTASNAGPESEDFSFVATRNTIAANSNKINAITTDLQGTTYTITVEGETGNVMAGTDINFSPAVLDDWDAASWLLTSTEVDIDSGTQVLTDRLADVLATGATGQGFPYLATYTFELLSGAPAVISPITWVDDSGMGQGQSDNEPKHSPLRGGSPSGIADLSIEKTVDNATPLVGETVTFTVTVSNVGSAATGVEIEDVLSGATACFTDVVYSQPLTGNTWTTDVPMGTTASPGTATLTITGTAACEDAFTNTATITDTGDVTDIDPSNDGPVDATVDPIDPPSSVDIAVRKEILSINRDKTSNEYGYVTYRLTVENLSANNATGNDPSLGGGDRFIIQDPLSADFMFVSSTQMMGGAGLGYGKYDPTTGKWGLNTLEAGNTKFIDITVKLADPTTAPDAIDNTATLDTATLDQLDSDLPNNEASAQLLIADVAVTKAVDDATPDEGQEITFTITVTNNSPHEIGTFEVEDIFSDISGLSDIASDTFTLTPDNPLGPGDAAQFEITATVTGPVDFTNMATLVGLPGNMLDPNPDNNMGMVDVTPNVLDLEVLKSFEILNEVAGRVKFTLTVNNLGPADAEDILLTDVADPAFVIDPTTISGDGDFDLVPGGGLWMLAFIAAGDGATVMFEADVVSATVLTANPVNAISLTEVDQFETNPDNNEDEVEVPAADLAVEKTITDKDGNPIDPTMLDVGQVVAFQIKVTNNGPADVTDVMVKDELTIFHPDGSSEVVALSDILDASHSSVSPNTVFDPWNTPQWLIPSLPTGAMETLTISGKVKVAHPFKNVAFLMGLTGAVDYNADNNMAMVLSTPKAVDLAVGKEIIDINLDKTSDAYGHVTYRLTVENRSDILATGNDPSLGDGLRFIIQDPLSTHFMFVSSTQMMGDVDLGYGKYDPATGNWGLNVLEPGKTKFIDITVKLADPTTAPDAIDNTATLDTSTLNEFEKTPDDNAASAQLLIADIAVTKTVDDATPNEGQEITFTITVTNNSPHDLASVTAEDVFSDISGLSGVTSETQLLEAPIEAGDAAEFEITATVTGPVDFTNMATLVGLPSGVLDPDPDNNMETVEVMPNTVDLEVLKAVEILSEVPGRVKFELTVNNLGPDDATNIVLTDVADAALVIDLATVAGDGTFDGTSWTLAALNAGSGATLTFEADVLSTDVLSGNPVNTVSLTDVDQFETNPDNNEDEVEVPAADIVVEKSVDNDMPELWETITFTVKVTNQGPADATNVMVKDPVKDVLTGSLAAIVINAETGSYDLQTGTWTIPSLAAGEMAVLNLTGEVSQAGTFKNVATLMGLEGAVDYNPSNNMAMASVTPVGADAIDLELVKTVDLDNAAVGDNVTFSITVTNSAADGPVVDATNIVVADYLPDGLAYIWDTATSPADDSRIASVDQNTLTWIITSLSADESITLTFEAEVTGFGDLINVAEVWDVDQTGLDRDSQTGAEGGAFDAIANPADAEDDQDDAQVWVPEPVQPKADLSLTKTVDNAAPRVGDAIVFTVTIRNTGAATSGVQVRDLLRDDGGCFEASLTTVKPSKGRVSAYAGGGYLWLLDLAAGETATLTLEGWVRCKTWFSNEAEIIHSGTLPDASSGNDWAGVEVRPGGGITPPPTGGDALCYLVADNDGEGLDSRDVLTALYGGAKLDVKVGHTGTTHIEAIAFNPWNRQLYAADARRLGTLNLQTGLFSAVGGEFGGGWGIDQFGKSRYRAFLDVDGLAFDPFGGDKLYGSVRKVGEPDLLIRIDPATGGSVANAFGPDRDYVTIQGIHGLTDIDDIAVSPWDGTLYAINNRDGKHSRLVRLDRQTGVATKVMDLPLGNVEGLGFFGDGTLYGTAGEGNESLVIIHLASGSASVHAGIGAGGRDYESVDCLTNKTNRLEVAAPASGVSLTLMRDLDGDGAGDLSVASTVTGDDGMGQFEIAATGTFLVQSTSFSTTVAASVAGFGAEVSTELSAGGVSTDTEVVDEVPEQFVLGQNYPNPFNPVTTIGFSLPETVDVRLAVYDVLGRQVAVLVDGVQAAGQHSVRFDAAGLQSGAYLYRLTVDGQVAQTRRLVLMK